MIRILAERKGLKFIVSIDEHLPEEVYVDSNRLNQVLLNLLSNAIKFTKTGHVMLRIQRSWNNYLHFACIDTGYGISE